MVDTRSFEVGAPGVQLNTLTGRLIWTVHRSPVPTSQEETNNTFKIIPLNGRTEILSLFILKTTASLWARVSNVVSWAEWTGYS